MSHSFDGLCCELDEYRTFALRNLTAATTQNVAAEQAVSLCSAALSNAIN
jgi:hypothetical protein